MPAPVSRPTSVHDRTDAGRARRPDRTGYAVHGGVRTYYEVFGDGATTLLFMGTFPVVGGRQWKAQVPYLARHFRVITYDPRGNGRSDRPVGRAAYEDEVYVADTIAVMDATDTDAAFLVALCSGVRWALGVAHTCPERVRGLVAIAPNVPVAPQAGIIEPVTVPRWRGRYEEWAEYHSDLLLGEPHSSKVRDDLIEWALQTDETVLADRLGTADVPGDADETKTFAEALDGRLLVLHGAADQCQPLAHGTGLAEVGGGRLVVLDGSGHLPHARHPVLVNTLIKQFVDRHTVAPPAVATPWLFARERRRRALWVCSPIGLGHVLRDVAIARALRTAVPDLEIHWLAQEPVTSVLADHGEIVHPASADLSSESAHWESEASDHDLHAFYAFRRMDEIFCANYMLFDDVVRETPYDLWVGDESWEVDHFLHENPERKIAPYAFLTDVVGFLPVDADGDPREAALCADYNAEMIEHLARFPYVRDRSVFIGGFDELPDASFGPGLPRVRDWSAEWFTSVPYVVPFDAAAYRRPAALRTRLGYGTGYPLYVAAVGGTAVGRNLLELTAEAFALVRREQPDARMVMVTGPRLDPRELPDVEGMDKRGYVPELFAHLACADVAIVQGGLSTTMELVAARRPFVYFPLAHHWEQQHFVAHRLDHYRAGTRMDYATTTPRDLAAAMIASGGMRPDYRPIRSGGARRAAARLASLVRR